MGIIGIPLNIGTTMAAAIAIGIAVDDTMHFMLRYNKELKSKKSKYAAMYETIHSEALPVLATSLALISGFLVFSLSNFEPVAQFGLLSALVMFAALVADFVITPLAISSLRLVSLWDMLSLTLRREVIEKSALFKHMKPWQIRKFILASSVQHYRKDQQVFQDNDDSDTMFMVMRGKVKVEHHSSLQVADIIENFLPGDVFGDISMFAELPRSSIATATEQTSLLVLSREGIKNTTNYHPVTSAQLFFNIATHVSKRFSALIHSDQKKISETVNNDDS
jgi:CRP-like cAMP-binding protein